MGVDPSFRVDLNCTHCFVTVRIVVYRASHDSSVDVSGSCNYSTLQWLNHLNVCSTRPRYSMSGYKL